MTLVLLIYDSGFSCNLCFHDELCDCGQISFGNLSIDTDFSTCYDNYAYPCYLKTCSACELVLCYSPLCSDSDWLECCCGLPTILCINEIENSAINALEECFFKIGIPLPDVLMYLNNCLRSARSAYGKTRHFLYNLRRPTGIPTSKA